MVEPRRNSSLESLIQPEREMKLFFGGDFRTKEREIFDSILIKPLRTIDGEESVDWTIGRRDGTKSILWTCIDLKIDIRCCIFIGEKLVNDFDTPELNREMIIEEILQYCQFFTCRT